MEQVDVEPRDVHEGAHRVHDEIQQQAQQIERVVPSVQRVVLDVASGDHHEKRDRVARHAGRLEVYDVAVPRVHVLGAEGRKAEEKDDRCLRPALQAPSRESGQIERRRGLALLVKRRECQARPLGDVLIEGERDARGDRDDRPSRERNRVEEGGAREPGIYVEQQLDERDVEGAVERVLRNERRPLVRVAAVHQQQPLQKAEAPNRVVGSACCLQPLLPGDPDADVRLLYHRNVVSAVANRQRHPLPLLDQLDDGALLRRCHTAADHAVCLRSELAEGVQVVLEREAQRPPFDNHRDLSRAATRAAVAAAAGSALPNRRQVLGDRAPDLIGGLATHHEQGRAARLGRHKPARAAHLDRRCVLVACEHPEAKVRSAQQRDRLGDALLQPVLDRRRAEQGEVALNRVVHLEGDGGGRRRGGAAESVAVQRIV